ncbi:MAG: pilus assembly protein TadD, partial [Mesorhizobium sp.]
MPIAAPNVKNKRLITAAFVAALAASMAGCG